MTATEALDIISAQYNECNRKASLAWAREEYDEGHRFSAQAFALWDVSRTISNAILESDARKRAAG